MKKFLTMMLVGAALCAPIAGTVYAEDAAEKTEEKAAAPSIVVDTPILVTDCGQGNSATLISVMLRRARGVEYESKPLATVEDLEGMKSLVIGVGASTKGLGAAGLDASQEMERIRSLVKKAEEMEIPIVGFHIGGMPRRGELSDGFNEYVLRNSDLFILYSGGNEDGFFTRISEASEVPMITVDRKPDIGSELIKMIATEESED
ncbi:MAG: hypothetical protein JJU11_01700 [Candidatus Sumerlaeia bacterium]|nr:hypothetical protein [Candidatus Sumerlaeia bacterium]